MLVKRVVIVKMLSKSGESKKIPKKVTLNDNVSVKGAMSAGEHAL